MHFTMIRTPKLEEQPEDTKNKLEEKTKMVEEVSKKDQEAEGERGGDLVIASSFYFM